MEIATQIENIQQQAKGFFNESRGSHDWDHTLRVHRLSQRIGAKEKADLTVLSVAAYLHDIGRARQDRVNGGVCHAEVGAQMAQPARTWGEHLVCLLCFVVQSPGPLRRPRSPG